MTILSPVNVDIGALAKVAARHALYESCRLATTIRGQNGSFSVLHSSVSASEDKATLSIDSAFFGTPINQDAIDYLATMQEFNDALATSGHGDEYIIAQRCEAYRRRLLLFSPNSFLRCSADSKRAKHAVEMLRFDHWRIQNSGASPDRVALEFSFALRDLKCRKRKLSVVEG